MKRRRQRQGRSRMWTEALLFLLPAVTFASIHVNLRTGADQNIAEVEILGSSVEILPDGERDVWKLNDGQLKDATAAYSGRRPDDVYLKSPTPWGDLYRRKNWRQVQRTLVPRNARILGIRSEPVIVTTREFTNNSSAKATFNAGINQAVDETVSSTWNRGGNLQVAQEIYYKVDFGVGEIGGTTTYAFSSSWGQETSKSQSVTVGSSTGVQVLLEPGQAVVAVLTATRGTMEVEVDYRAKLSGIVVCNYEDPFKGHFFWAYDVNACLSAAGHPRSIDSTETLRIGFYADARVVVSDQVKLHKLLDTKVPVKRVY
ncbi:hypothetical protein O0L34_g18918 [Tuta absoluta]|nr:hypothetical protein O0L34_g18918 [Tuta absoluta]